MRYLSIPNTGHIRIHDSRTLEVRSLFQRTLELTKKIRRFVEKKDSLRFLIPEECYVVHTDYDINDPDATVYKRTITRGGRLEGIAFSSQALYKRLYPNFKPVRHNEFVIRYDRVCHQISNLYRARDLYRNLILKLATPRLEKNRNYHADNCSGTGRVVIGDWWFYAYYDLPSNEWVIDWKDPVDWKIEL